MTGTNIKRITIPKEKAIFWLDKDGVWQNEHGRFEHPRIARFFHSSIQKDEMGYFVHQKTDTFEEKVYFRYEDTAIFVFDLVVNDHIDLVLNTGEKILLNPEQLVQKNDSLYVITPVHFIKFTQKALVKLSKYMEEKDGVLCLNVNDKSWDLK